MEVKYARLWVATWYVYHLSRVTRVQILAQFLLHNVICLFSLRPHASSKHEHAKNKLYLKKKMTISISVTERIS